MLARLLGKLAANFTGAADAQRCRIWCAVARGLAGVAMCLPLAACYDMEIKQTLRRDGTLNVGMDFRFDPEVEDIFGFAEAVMKLQPGLPADTWKDGLCGAGERALKATPNATAQQIAFSGRQMREGNQFVCQLEMGLGSAKQTFAGMQTNPGMLMSPYKVKIEGPQRYRVMLDFAAMPDPDSLIQMAMLANMADPKRQGPGMQPAKMPSNEALAELTTKYRKASIASAKLFGGHRKVTFAIAAPKILETNGQVSADRQSVKFTMTWLELTETLFDPAKRRAANYFAVIEH